MNFKKQTKKLTKKDSKEKKKGKSTTPSNSRLASLAWINLFISGNVYVNNFAKTSKCVSNHRSYHDYVCNKHNTKLCLGTSTCRLGVPQWKWELGLENERR